MSANGNYMKRCFRYFIDLIVTLRQGALREQSVQVYFDSYALLWNEKIACLGKQSPAVGHENGNIMDTHVSRNARERVETIKLKWQSLF